MVETTLRFRTRVGNHTNPPGAGHVTVSMLDYTAIKDVVASCRDAEQRFRGASSAAPTPALKNLFTKLSLERAGFADELLQAARGMGMDIPDSSGVAGTLHSGWIEIKGALTGHDEHRIVEEAASGEETCLTTYRQALAMNLAGEVRAILERQVARVQQSHDQIFALRDTAAQTPVEQSH
jgi:uncharacterized protein (TIGR02284 family)